jgi:hypothetical protein
MQMGHSSLPLAILLWQEALYFPSHFHDASYLQVNIPLPSPSSLIRLLQEGDKACRGVD